MSAITAKASRKMKKYAVLTREPRCFLGSFDFSWEQRKLGDIGKARSGVGFPDAEQGGVTGIPFFKVSDMNLDGNENEMTVANNYVTAEQIAVHRWSPITELPAIFFAKVGAAVMLNRKRLCRFPFLLDNNTMAYSLSSTKWDADFAKALFGTVDLTSLVQVGALPSYNAGDVESMEIYLPSLLEQEQIGGFFKQLDTLITLHQRKCVFLFGLFQASISMIFTASTFSWEQRKFEEIAVRSSVICSDDTLPRVEYEDIVSGTGRLNKDIYAKQSIKSGIAFHQGDVLYGKLRPYLQNWLLPTFDGLAVGDFWVLQPQNADSSFLYRLIQSRQFDEVANQSTGTKMPRADWKLVSKTVFSIPSNISEQAAIGTYFTALDSLITLHQRECISFTVRAGGLILTANKKRTTSSWEQRKLGEIGSVSMCRRIFKEQTSETGDIPFYKIGTFGADPDAFISRELFEEYKSKYPYPQKGDILISASGSIGRAVEFAGNNEYFQDSNIVWLNHDERLSNPFLKCFYSVVKWAGIEGSTIKRLYNDNILNTVICMPSVPEQKRIGLFFENLDNLITLHQRKPFLMKWRTSDANRNQTNRLVL